MHAPCTDHSPAARHLFAGSVLIVSLFANATVGASEAAFNNNCRTCHSAKANDNRAGPSLHGVVGRKAGSAPGFSGYSQSMKSSGITWDEASLDKFIANPDAVVPNNAMKPFKGVPDKTVRTQIVEFLKSTGQ